LTLNRGMLTSDRPDWCTPSDLYETLVNSEPRFDTSDRHDGRFDAFRDLWPEPWFCNPPYGRALSMWTDRMKGRGVALVPARTDTRWAQDLLSRCRAVLFIKGRLHFDDAPRAAPFPSMLVFMGEMPNLATLPADGLLVENRDLSLVLIERVRAPKGAHP
jgi:hypothetical protein